MSATRSVTHIGARTERALVDRCIDGDEQAWRELYDAHAPVVTRVAARILLDAGAVNDVVQAVFIECFRNLRAFRGDAKLSTWLCGVTVRVVSTHRRTEGRHRRRVAALAQEPVAPDGASPERAAVARDQVDQVRVALASVPLQRRAAFVMREVEGLSTRDVAEILEIPEATVRTHVARARRAILAQLSQWQEGEES
jgi:RNA polymerase sigma factor (sigma-70 family)